MMFGVWFHCVGAAFEPTTAADKCMRVLPFMVVGEVLVCGLIKGNIPGCCCCFSSLFLYSLSHTVMRNGSWGVCGTSTAQFIIHVIHTKASCSEQTQKISISPPSLFFLSRFESLFFINPLYVTSSLLMVLSSYHLTGKLIPVFDYCQPQHNDPYRLLWFCWNCRFPGLDVKTK